MILKKTLALLLAFGLIFSSMAPSLAQESNNKYENAGQTLKELGVLVGDESGNLLLDQNLKRQHMVVLISVLYGERELASKFVGINKFKDLKPEHRQDIHYINWAVSKGLISGNPDGTFGIDEMVTVHEYQSVLLRALGYNITGKDWLMVPQFSEAYGLMQEIDVNPSEKMNRGVMAMMTINALKQEKNGQDISLAESLNIDLPEEIKVDSELTIKHDSINISGQVENEDSLWISLKPVSTSIDMEERYSPIPIDQDGNFNYDIKDLEVGEYMYRFQSGYRTTKYKSFKIDVSPFELENGGAENLKEIYLTFTHPVNKAQASAAGNYSTTAGSIDNVSFEDDGRTIVLTLNEPMVEDRDYRISANLLRSISGEELNLRDHDFRASDDRAPEIDSISQLGDKGIRVYFSEPVKRNLVTNFQVDSKSLFVNAIYENNSISLIYHSGGELADGNHTLSTYNIEDYSGKKLKDSEFDFRIGDDKNPPKLKTTSAARDKIVLVFDKDIDPDSVSKNNIYWKSRNNRYPESVRVVSNTIHVDFSNNIIPDTKTPLYILGIRDYFGNKFSETLEIEPVADSDLPNVIAFKLADDGSSIDVSYNKDVYGSDKEDYRILDQEDRNIDIKEIQGSGREFKIILYRPLPLGRNTLEIDGVEDRDKNLVPRFRADLSMKDREKPKIVGHTGYGNNIVINFSKEMDESTVRDPSNYIMRFKSEQHRIPTNASFIFSQDKKTLTILLPESYNGEKLKVGRDGNISQLDITQLKDIYGNDTSPLILTINFDEDANGRARSKNYYSQRPGRNGILSEPNTIKIKFNMPIIYAEERDFSIVDREISRVSADGTDIVTIELRDEDFTSMPRNSVRIERNNNMRTYIDTGVEAETIYLWDEIPPRIRKDITELGVYRDQIEIPFTEELESSGAELYRRDLEVIRLKDNKLLSEEDYSTSLDSRDKSMLLVNIDKLDLVSDYSVRLKGYRDRDSLSYIRDKDGNLALPSKIYSTSDSIRRR